ncbi:transmembrane protein 214-A-like isoform X2 [Lineus longissimus]|uniref:transmembrane protein 214-A-like isoform X2 n=1 Tax=Lineus longissimus TaxID=88925 RepID=UPI002B4EFD54
MAMTGKGWEMVGKTTKKGKNGPNTVTKSQKKILQENMPRIEIAAPLKESSTIYDAFADKERRSGKEQIRPQDGGHGGGDIKGKKQQGQKKKFQEKKKIPLVSFEEALKQVDVSELDSLLTKDQAVFPDNPSVWLKDLASFLNIKFDHVKEPDPVFSDHPVDYPLCKVTERMKKLLKKALSLTTPEVKELFFEHCVQSMIQDLGKGASTYGYRIFIQLMAHGKPDIIQNSLSRYLEMLKTNQNRQLRCLSVMWAVGQSGMKDLSCGLRVWLDVMFPVLRIRALSEYAIDYLENLFKLHGNIKSSYSTINFRDFFPILDVVFSSNSGVSLPSNQQKKLLTLYPKIKTIAFGSDREANLKNFFPSFLARVTPDCNKAFKNELLQCLITCLSEDKHCYSVWRQTYVRHVSQSRVLLDHLRDNWSVAASKLDRKILRETIRTFCVTNEDLAAKPDGEEYEECNKTCKVLLTKLSGSQFPWFLFFVSTFALVGGLVIYDVHSHGSFKGCKTATFLEETGTMTFCASLWRRLQIYFGIVCKWLEENVPYYFSRTVDFVGPYLLFAWTKLCELGSYLMEVSQPVRAWVSVKFLEILSWVQQRTPYLYDSASYYLLLTWDFVVFYSLLFWKYLVQYTNIIVTWIRENILTGSWSVENLQKVLTSCLVALRGYIRSFINYVSGSASSSSAAPAG